MEIAKKEVNKNDSIDKNCLTSRQADYIYKKEELGSLINTSDNLVQSRPKMNVKPPAKIDL